MGIKDKETNQQSKELQRDGEAPKGSKNTKEIRRGNYKGMQTLIQSRENEWKKPQKQNGGRRTKNIRPGR